MSDFETDAILLDRFSRLHEEEAFVALVRRHGPEVLKVCRRFLRHEPDVEDVFQATFLVLAQKASRIAWTGSIDAWLRNVARRLALHARAGLARRHRNETVVTNTAGNGEHCTVCELIADTHPESDPTHEVERRDLRVAIDEALERLPEKYRAPVVLCYLEGKTNEEAARQLGWPAGSMSRRLERGRYLLRQSLSRYGMALCIALAGLTAWAYRGSFPETRPHYLGFPPGRFPAVRQAMEPLAAQDQENQDFEEIVSRLTKGGSASSDREELAVLADRARQTAERIENLDPGYDQEFWRDSVTEMKEAAEALARGARQGDRVEMASTARRLDATCVRCHGRFRRVSFSETRSDRLGVWSRDRVSDKIH